MAIARMSSCRVVVDCKERSKPVRYNGLANVVLLKTGDISKIVAFTWTTK